METKLTRLNDISPELADLALQGALNQAERDKLDAQERADFKYKQDARRAKWERLILDQLPSGINPKWIEFKEQGDRESKIWIRIPRLSIIEVTYHTTNPNDLMPTIDEATSVELYKGGSANIAYWHVINAQAGQQFYNDYTDNEPYYVGYGERIGCNLIEDAIYVALELGDTEKAAQQEVERLNAGWRDKKYKELEDPIREDIPKPSERLLEALYEVLDLRYAYDGVNNGDY